METVTDFIFLGSKITADGDCSREIKRRLLLGRKVMANLDTIFKSRDISLPTKICMVKALAFAGVIAQLSATQETPAESPPDDRLLWSETHGHQMAVRPCFLYAPNRAAETWDHITEVW